MKYCPDCGNDMAETDASMDELEGQGYECSSAECEFTCIVSSRVDEIDAVYPTITIISWTPV
jgi:hypothetical protein